VYFVVGAQYRYPLSRRFDPFTTLQVPVPLYQPLHEGRLLRSPPWLSESNRLSRQYHLDIVSRITLLIR